MAAERRVYGVFAGDKFGVTTNKNIALKQAKLLKGKIRFISLKAFNEGAWDRPTFFVSSTPLRSEDRDSRIDV